MEMSRQIPFLVKLLYTIKNNFLKVMDWKNMEFNFEFFICDYKNPLFNIDFILEITLAIHLYKPSQILKENLVRYVFCLHISFSLLSLMIVGKNKMRGN
jgi:hypothetical protein